MEANTESAAKSRYQYSSRNESVSNKAVGTLRATDLENVIYKTPEEGA
ncbi:MAG: hypothetical protein P0107_02220 [Nitrosomonas sp.]|nr:hypothetical protein [Nitrosomonas sp.]